LADFDRRLGEFERRGAVVAGASVDAYEDAQRTVEHLGLKMPLAYGLDARDFSTQTGAFFSDAKQFIHATGFVLRRGGEVVEGLYSTSGVGRLDAAETIGLLDYLTRKQP
jgi:peroxiredoxin